MFNDPNTTHEIFSSRIKIPAQQYVGHQGRIFYHEDTGELRISDGVTPHGHPIFFAGGGGGGVGLALNLYKENGLPDISPVASVPRSIALGDGSLAISHGAIVHAAGMFSQVGDAQVGSYVARGITTNSTQKEIFLNGSTEQLKIAPNSSVAFVITVMARRTDSGVEGAVYEVRGGIDRTINAASTRIIGQITKHIISEDSPVWDLTVDADNSNGALRINVKGENGKTIRWVAHIATVEVKN